MTKFRTIPIIIVLFIMAFWQPVYGGEPDGYYVKIGLAVDQNQLILNLTGDECLLDLSPKEPTVIPIPGDQVLITAFENNIAVNFWPVGAGPLVVLPGAQLLSWDSREYRGEFLIVAKNNRLNLINRLPLEDYLRGVVPREVPAGWPMAALKAQAIAARTYTIASLGRHSADAFDLCPTEHCQVYGGAAAETEATDRAVADTVGEVIKYRGKIISALYHSSSGGMTADAVDLWNSNVPYLKPVLDWDQNSPYTQWSKYFNWDVLQGLSSRAYPQIGRVKRIQGVTFSQDGKLRKITLVGDLGQSTISGEQFRFLLGLPSSRVQIGVIYGPEPLLTLWWVRNEPYPQALMANQEIPGLTADLLNPPWDLADPFWWLQDKEPLRIVCKGSGWGHGVGLSQWGAKGMADNGFNERQILEHFYPGVTISGLK
ncbi:MAG: SpoIID/LytB domain-containing protein [Bacillota bacterium]